jgi:ABC-2 type transport system permease protein
LILGLSLLTSALQVVYRDVEYIVQVLLMVLFFLTPGVYTLEEIVNKNNPLFTKVYMLNPLVGLLNQYRVTLMGGYLSTLPPAVNFLNTFIIPSLCSIAVLLFGFFVFKRYEKRFPDYLNV